VDEMKTRSMKFLLLAALLNIPVFVPAQVYQVGDAGQKKAPEFAGQKVTIKGRLSRKHIRVTSIETAA
jgi:hypothetical protein